MHVGQIRVIPYEDLSYTAAFQRPSGHVWSDFEFADDYEQAAARDRQRAAATDRLITLDKELWDWSSWQFPGTCPPYSSSYFPVNASGRTTRATEPTLEGSKEETSAPVYPSGPSGPNKHRAEYIREKMRAAGLFSAEDLSSISHIDTKTIRRLLDGQPITREDVLECLAAALKVKARDIPEN